MGHDRNLGRQATVSGLQNNFYNFMILLTTYTPLERVLKGNTTYIVNFVTIINFPTVPLFLAVSMEIVSGKLSLIPSVTVLYN
jgi:hypothetical protein